MFLIVYSVTIDISVPVGILLMRYTFIFHSVLSLCEIHSMALSLSQHLCLNGLFCHSHWLMLCVFYFAVSLPDIVYCGNLCLIT
jgi:hypothetical protein